MALMFQRLARNFVRNGYFPTDAETTSRVLSALEPAEGEMRVIDPCAGEGVALAECKHHLGADRTRAFGIEYDAERAWHAKELLDRCIHGDVQDCIISRRAFGLLWLNPPYGDLISDKGATGTTTWKGRKRLEKLFYSLSHSALQFGGLMVLIVPAYSLDAELSGWIAAHFERVRVYLAPEQQFKQVVVFGVRRRTGGETARSEAKARLQAVGEGQWPEVLPAVWANARYRVPAAPPGDLSFAYTRMEPRQLLDEIRRTPCLWGQFQTVFGAVVREHRPPLRALSRWHLALALAAGQISGVVRSRDGKTYVVKGDTHKEKAVKLEAEARANGTFAEVRTLTDKFVPVIRALDFTPGSPSFGRALVIR